MEISLPHPFDRAPYFSAADFVCGKRRDTPLHALARHIHRHPLYEDMCRDVIAAGAHIHQPNEEGETGADILRQQGATQLIEMSPRRRQVWSRNLNYFRELLSL
jgi:hypothetical protein